MAVVRLLLLLTLLLGLVACTGAQNDSAESVATSVGATLTALANAPTATPRTTTNATPRPTATRNTAPSPTPDPLVWDAILGFRDVGAPLPKSARSFGGGFNVPAAAFTDDQTATFTDSIQAGVNAYFPNAYDGDTPIRLPDGTDVAQVRYFVFDEGGNTVYQYSTTETPFCLFGVTNGQCDTLDFAANGCQWLVGDGTETFTATSGFHSVNVNIIGSDGFEEGWFATFELRFSPNSPCT